MSLNRFQGNINASISNSSAIQFASSYTIYVTPVGARVNAVVSASATITVDKGHSFIVGDKALIDPGGDNTLSVAITAITRGAAQDTLTMGATTYSIASGAVMVNLGPDTGSSTPNYDTIPMAITSQPDGGSLQANPSLTTDASGNYEFYHRGDGKFWLLILDSTGAIADVIQGIGGLGRLNICDFGAVMDGSTDDGPRIEAAINTLPAQGGEVYAPAGDIYLGTSVEVTRGAFTLRCNPGARFVVDAAGVKCLYVNATSTVYDVSVIDMWCYDPDPPGHVGAEESHGIWLVKVDRANIIRGKFDSLGDESIQIGTDCKNVLIDGCTFIDGSHEATDGGTVNFNNCDNVVIQNCRFYNNQSGPCILVTTGTSGSTDHIRIANNLIDTTLDQKSAGADAGAAIAVNAGAQAGLYLSIDGNHIKDAFAMGITLNTTGGGTFDYVGIRNNLIEGGGGNASAVAQRGAINVAAATNYGVISGNVISNWGDTAAYHSGIRVNLDGFVIANNSIFGTTNNTYCIYSAGSGSTGNFIHGNISEKPIFCAEPDTLGLNKVSASNIVTLAASATPSVLGGRLFKTSGTTTITNFTNGVVGQEIVVLATDSITITDNATIVLNAGGNYAMTDTDTLTLVMFASGVWSETARSVN